MKVLKTLGMVLFCLLLLSGACVLAIFIVKPQWLGMNKETETVEVIEPEVEKEEAEEVVPEPLSRAEEILNTMSLEEKIGQIFFVRWPETDLEATMALHPGGLLMFAQDFEGLNRTQVQEKIAAAQSLSSTPLLIGVDEEGGIVNRVSLNPQLVPTPFPSAQALYNEGGLPEVAQDAKTKSSYLLDLGINVNLAPVADVAYDPNDYMYSRTVGLDAQNTAEYVATVVDAMNQSGIGSCLKHFPGYGNNIDTHQEIAVDQRDRSVFESEDFLPFKAGIEHDAPAILVAHNIVTCFDDVPASLSKTVHDVLRNELGFEGVILSDDLFMEAIRQFTNGEDPSVQAFLAGNDLLTITDFEQGYASIKQAVSDGVITEAMLDESILRILNWKLELGLLK